jgi:hypothetical protein
LILTKSMYIITTLIAKQMLEITMGSVAAGGQRKERKERKRGGFVLQPPYVGERGDGNVARQI